MMSSRGNDPYAEAITQVLQTVTDLGVHKERLQQLSAAHGAAKSAQDELAQAQEIAHRREADLNARQTAIDARERALKEREAALAQATQAASDSMLESSAFAEKVSLAASALESETQKRQLAFKAQEESFAEHARLLASMQADLSRRMQAADAAKASADALAESHQSAMAKLRTILPA